MLSLPLLLCYWRLVSIACCVLLLLLLSCVGYRGYCRCRCLLSEMFCFCCVYVVIGVGAGVDVVCCALLHLFLLPVNALLCFLCLLSLLLVMLW